MRLSKLAPLALALPLAVPFLSVGTAFADGSASANLSPVVLNGSNGSGTAMVKVTGTTIEFTLAASGLAAGPHAAHIHFGANARHECPAVSDDANHDGRLTTTEGAPAYGAVVVSLTKTGDTSPKSGLAVDRFAAGSNIQYMRGGVTVSSEIARAIEQGKAVVVVHGVKYTGAKAQLKSDLNPMLPASATDPAICGRLVSAPAGGAATGAGGTSTGTDNTALLAAGGALLVGAAGASVLTARRARA